ncbi:hypothetical protein ABT084_11270 [Streptomyces sp. NPDC002138]|uniref:hypothetical protein n=1 Tax=Streptomyces sp. NPDC002138 TaxID=3154410 RepID=UPI00332B7233
MNADTPQVVINPPEDQGQRRVRVDGADLGRARDLRDILEFLRRAGLDPDDIDPHDDTLFTWNGGGPDWSQP